MDFIDFFAGMGTVRMGFEQAGHTCVYSVEWDKQKRRIYNVIFGKEPEGCDIRELRGSDLPRADIWCFGAPCQDFSVAGKREGLEGNRSSMVLEIFRLLRETPEEHRPKYLLYENVKGMLSSNKGFDFLEILYQMGELGYSFREWQLLNSKDFGVPQNRERVFTIGHFRGRSTRKVFPIGGQVNKYTTIGKSTKTTIARTFTAGGHSGGNHSGMTIIKEVSAVCDTSRINKDMNGRRIKNPEEPMFTLTVQDRHGVLIKEATKSGGRQPFVVNGYRIRRLTPRECMRLQGVPDTITDKLIEAKISDTQMYRAAGDACTVNVIYEIAKRL